MKKTSLGILVLALVFSLALIKIAKAQDYGPPANIPNFDASQIPAGINIPNGPPAGVNMGPSAAQLDAQARGEAMQAAGEAKQKEAEKKAFEKMSKNINQFERGVNIIKAQVKKLNAKGAPTTPAMQAEIDKLDEFLTKLKAATTIDELQPLFESFGDLMDSSQEQLQIMSKSSKWPQVQKQAENLLARLDKESSNLKARAAKAGLADELANNLADLDKAIADQRATLETLKTQVKTDPDAVFDNIGDYFDKFRDIYENNVREIASSLDLRRAVKTELPKFINGLDKRVKSLANNKKIDAGELKDLVSEAKAKFNEIKTMTAGKINDMEAVITSIDELTDISVKFEDKWQELTGKDVNAYMPSDKLLQGDAKDYKVNLPAGLNGLIK